LKKQAFQKILGSHFQFLPLKKERFSKGAANIQGMLEFTHRERFKIFAFTTDCHKKISAPALIRLLQETAMGHVRKLQLSVYDLQPLHLTWVLLRMRVDFFKRPELGEIVHVLTYPCGIDRFLTFRDYFMYDEQGELVATAATTWLLMDTRTRRMARIPDVVAQKIPSAAPEGRTPLPHAADKLPPLGNPQAALDFRVNWHDLDFNAHLNNVTYIEWMLESLPDEILENAEVKQIEVIFNLEAQWKEVVRSEVQPTEDGSFLHQLIRVSNGKILANGRSVFG
jgi:acyl-ACP thioesterase